VIFLLETQAPTHALASRQSGASACRMLEQQQQQQQQENCRGGTAPLWEVLVTMAHRWPMVSLVNANSASTRKNMKNLPALA